MKVKLLLIVIISFFMVQSTCEVDKDVWLPLVQRPNILLVIADDMGEDATPGYFHGTEKAHCPNLDQLRASGITYENVWAAPVCSPTRATILTGKYGIRNGVTSVGDPIALNDTSIQRYLDIVTDSAYAHAVIGKWHLANRNNGRNDNPNLMGVGHYSGVIGGGVPNYYSYDLVTNGMTTPDTTYATTKFTDLAIDWIDQQTKPWFLWLAHVAPHTPIHAPPAHLHHQGSLPEEQDSIDANPDRYYRAMIEALDTELGRLLSSMTLAERANTLIIFLGDNGTPGARLQDHGNGHGKGSLYQGGVNVPMIISGRHVTRMGERDSSLINTADLYATIADYAYTFTGSIHDSQSFWYSFWDANYDQRTYSYAETADEYCIRNSRFKLIQRADSSQEMYNVLADPTETSELIANGLNALQAAAKTRLETEAALIRN